MQTDISMCPLGPERSHHISIECASQSLQSALDAIQLVPQPMLRGKSPRNTSHQLNSLGNLTRDRELVFLTLITDTK